MTDETWSGNSARRHEIKYPLRRKKAGYLNYCSVFEGLLFKIPSLEWNILNAVFVIFIRPPRQTTQYNFKIGHVCFLI
jgi:hypothetical protein